jgi:membrane protease YdiL (CAAX protease family)
MSRSDPEPAREPFFQEVVDDFVIGRVLSEQLPALAIEALDRGHDSPSLRMLAGWTPARLVDPVALFRRAAEELGATLDDEASVIRRRCLPLVEAAATRRLHVGMLPERLTAAVGSAALGFPSPLYALHSYATDYVAYAASPSEQQYARTFEHMAVEEAARLLAAWRTTEVMPMTSMPGAPSGDSPRLAPNASPTVGSGSGAAPPDHQRSTAGTIIAWTVIVLAVAALLVGRVVREKSRDAAGTKPQRDAAAELSMRIIGRYAVGAKLIMGSLPGGNQEQQIGKLADEVEQVAVASPLTRVRAAPVVAELSGTDRAMKLLESIESDEAELEDDVRDLGTIYSDGSDALGEGGRQRLLERHDWFGKLAVTWGKPDDDPLRREALAAARRTAIVALVAMLGGIGVGVLALGLFVTAIVLLALGRFQRGYERPSAPSRAGVFLEAFALYLAWLIGGSLLAGALGAREGNLKWFWIVVIGSAPLACLWPLVRGVSFQELRRGLGWHPGRGWIAELGAGVGGYLAGIPVIVAGIAITVLLSRVMGAQPTHPIVEEISGRLPDVLKLLLLASVYAPLAEETMFRGALYHGVRVRLPFIVASLIVSFIFAVIHPQGLAAVPALMGIAIVLAALREWRGSIVAPVVAHAINNGVILILLVLLIG